MEIYNGSGNLTIVLPVGCNAKCSFCVWDKKKPIDIDTWTNELSKILSNKDIMSKVHSISISGGEPTMNYDNVLDFVLSYICIYEVNKKVVLNTNGYRLYDIVKKSTVFRNVVNHINISRHSADCDINSKIFGTDSIINKDDIKEISNYFENNKIDIDITINMVYNNSTSIEEFYKMVDFCKKYDVHALAMRQDIELGLTRSYIDHQITKDRVVFENSCPVCKTISTVYRNFPITFKYGVRDTFIDIGKDIVYEFIYNENGKLTYDWGGKNIYKKSDFLTIEDVIMEYKPRTYGKTCGSGCGGSGVRNSCGSGC